jgi:hypothetical protein
MGVERCVPEMQIAFAEAMKSSSTSSSTRPISAQFSR